jgi:hypothetical protein
MKERMRTSMEKGARDPNLYQVTIAEITTDI